MIRIEGFQWDERNEEHLLKRHGVTPEEAEDVFFIPTPTSGEAGMVPDTYMVRRKRDVISLWSILI
ncbi:MAG: hypothetical protein ACE1ZS_12145 [Candidatus Poribacteria bacterium]